MLFELLNEQNYEIIGLYYLNILEKLNIRNYMFVHLFLYSPAGKHILHRLTKLFIRFFGIYIFEILNFRESHRKGIH